MAKYLSVKDVLAIHAYVIRPEDLQGQRPGSSIEAVVNRIDNRIQYGLMGDIFELAACYATYIAVGHAFNDTNKRTAFVAMDICLTLNGIELTYDVVEMGDIIRDIAQRKIDEFQLAEWLRHKQHNMQQAAAVIAKVFPS